MTTCSVEQSNLIWMTRASEGACMCSHRSKWLNGCWPMQQYAIPKGTPIQARQEVGHSLGQYCASPSRLTRQHALSTHCKPAQRSIPFSDPKLSGPRGWMDPTSWQPYLRCYSQVHSGMVFAAWVRLHLRVVAHLLELLYGLHDDIAHAGVAQDGHVLACPH